MFNFLTSSYETVCWMFEVGIFFINFLIGIFILKAPETADEYYFDVNMLTTLTGVNVGSNS